MSARWKRNTVVATMVLLVCAAVALNWKYTGEQAADAVEETGTKILGRPRWSAARRTAARPGRTRRQCTPAGTTSPPPG